MMLQPPAGETHAIPRWRLWVLWLLAGISLFFMLGEQPCQRTQEARVLVCAREMVSGGARRWVLPTCNGVPRLQKPPLPYWLSAVAFAVSGQVIETTGRLPAAVAAWLTLLLTYYAGTTWFSQRAGVMAAGMLLTSVLFYQYGRLAESDIQATLFVTFAVVLAWRGLDQIKTGESKSRAIGLFAGFGVATGAAFMAKGPPGVFPLLFVPLMAMLTRNWRGLLWSTVIGLPLALLLASPWYIYVYASGHWGVLARELAVVTRGDDHPGPWWELIIQTAHATAPWTVLCLLALLAAIRFRKTYPQLVGVICWLVAIYLPLVISVNKQLHYAMPAMPPLMLLCGWAMREATVGRLDGPMRQSLRYTLSGMLVIAAMLGLGSIIWAALMSRGIYARGTGQFHVAMAALGIVLLAGGVAGQMLYFRRGLFAGTIAMLATLTAVMPLLFGPVSANLPDENTRDSGHSITDHAGSGPIVAMDFPSLPLVFAMKQVIPVVHADQLSSLAKQDATVIVEARPEDAPASLPGAWKMVWRGGPKGQHFQLFRPAMGAATQP